MRLSVRQEQVKLEDKEEKSNLCKLLLLRVTTMLCRREEKKLFRGI